MSVLKNAVLAATLLLPMLGATARADFTVTVISQAGKFKGCLAADKANGIILTAIGSSVNLQAKSDKFGIRPGDIISGSWAIDSGVPINFASTANVANTASFDVPNSADVVQALVAGKLIRVNVGIKSDILGLSEVGQAFQDLSTCMTTQKAPTASDN